MVRLFVGGLPPGITQDEVRGRFVSFGAVSSCEVIPAKGAPVTQPQQCRGFAYVDLDPKDDAALHKCLSLVRNFTHSAGRTFALL